METSWTDPLLADRPDHVPSGMQLVCINHQWLAFQFRLTLGRVLLDYIVYANDGTGNSIAESMRSEEVPRDIFLASDFRTILELSMLQQTEEAA